MHMNKQVHSSSWLCSTWGTNIARVEGWWLVNGPNCLVPETQMTAPRLVCALLIYFPPPKSVRDHCDIILWYHDCLLYSFGRKTTVHVQMKCHHSSASVDAKIPSYYCYTQTILSFLYPKFCACDTLPQVFQCTHVPEFKFIYNILQHLH